MQFRTKFNVGNRVVHPSCPAVGVRVVNGIHIMANGVFYSLGKSEYDFSPVVPGNTFSWYREDEIVSADSGDEIRGRLYRLYDQRMKITHEIEDLETRLWEEENK